LEEIPYDWIYAFRITTTTATTTAAAAAGMMEGEGWRMMGFFVVAGIGNGFFGGRT